MELANRAQGEIVNIVLDEHEDEYDTQAPIMDLKYPPRLVLVRLLSGRYTVHQILPITPMSKSFSSKIILTTRKNGKRHQLPIVPAYRSQGTCHIDRKHGI
jgi:hypothetical protein